MSIASTKSPGAERAPASPDDCGGEQKEPGERVASTARLPESVWRVLSAAVLIEAALIRLYELELNPLHQDEGINGYFLLRLFREGVYQYDPANYHGPTIYYFALPVSYLFGLNTFALRLVTVLFGTGTIWLVLCLRRHIGSTGAIAAAALVAVSPGAVYISRYFIHESLFVFFTLGLVVAALKYFDTSRAGYLFAAATSAALLFATKETAVLSAALLVTALFATFAFMKIRKTWPADNTQVERNLRSKPARAALTALAAIALFVSISTLFYSSFFTHREGVTDALKSFQIWMHTGTSDHISPWYTYIRWLLEEESPLVVLSVVGTALAILSARNRFAVFVALWSVGMLALYSIVPYKTPWLLLNVTIPMAIISGYGAAALYRRARGRWRRFPVLALFATALIFSLYQTIELNLFHYDDDAYSYVYVHTERSLYPFLLEINRIAKSKGTGSDTKIAVTSPEYWPLPWYLRDYNHVGYYGRVVEGEDAIIIASEAQEKEIQSSFGSLYRQVKTCGLRPGVKLILYAREDGAEK